MSTTSTEARVPGPSGPAIRINPDDRFIPREALRAAYIRYSESRAPAAPSFVTFADEGLEVGIVASAAPRIARAVSSVLTCSLEDAKDRNGGHLPAAVVERVQREIISPHGVASLWGAFGHRFVLSRAVDASTSEVVATILVARRKGTVFFFTGRYNNLRHSTMERDVDFEQPAAADPSQRWFDQFAFPPAAAFKPRAYHQIANFVVANEQRGRGLSRFLLDAIVRTYSRDAIERRGAPIEHSQFLLCGRGFWQIGDPPWLSRMERLGFYLRQGAESFFLEQPWAPLPPIFAAGAQVSNLAYNRSFGLPDRYLRAAPARSASAGVHLQGRIPEVIRLAEDPRAKLQYFQTMFDFV